MGLDEANQEYICKIACREMSILTCSEALKKSQTITVNPPDIVNDFRDNADRLRQGGEDIKAKIIATFDGDVVGDIGKKVASGGLFGSVIGAAANLADGALDKA